MARVTKDTMIGDLLQIDQNVAPLLLNIGMHCLGCPSSQMETIEEAAMVHGLDPDDLVVEINTFIDHDLGEFTKRRLAYAGRLLFAINILLKYCQRLDGSFFNNHITMLLEKCFIGRHIVLLICVL